MLMSAPCNNQFLLTPPHIDIDDDHLHPDIVVEPAGVVDAGPGQPNHPLCALQQHLHHDGEIETDDI